MDKIIDGNRIAADIKREIMEDAGKLSPKPKLTAFQVGENPASRVYVNSQKKAASCFNLTHFLHTLGSPNIPL